MSQPELLEQLKQRLAELEQVNMLNPDDIEMLPLRRTLRQEIAELEKAA